MKTSEKTREAYLRAMAAHVLDHGLIGASLRPLAKAAGTSDRMLIYHFGSKDGLMAALLELLAADFTKLLDGALPEAPMPSRRELLGNVLAYVRSPVVAAYIRVWREVTTLAGLGNAAHVDTGKVVIQGFVDWLERRMPVDDPNSYGEAQIMLTLIEGVHVMDAVGRSDVADAAIETLYPLV